MAALPLSIAASLEGELHDFTIGTGSDGAVRHWAFLQLDVAFSRMRSHITLRPTHIPLR